MSVVLLAGNSVNCFFLTCLKQNVLRKATTPIFDLLMTVHLFAYRPTGQFERVEKHASKLSDCMFAVRQQS